MAAIDDYGRLKTVVSETLHRTDLDDQMDNVSEMVNAEITERVRVWEAQGFDKLDDTFRVSTDSPQYGVPGDFAMLLDMYTGDLDSFGWLATSDKALQMTRGGNIDTLRRVAISGDKVPSDAYKVGVDSSSITFNAVPAPGTEFALHYVQFDAAMILDTDTTALLLDRPQIYIYGFCKHLAVFVQDIDMAQVYTQMFDAAIDSANFLHDESTVAGPVQMTGASRWV